MLCAEEAVLYSEDALYRDSGLFTEGMFSLWRTVLCTVAQRCLETLVSYCPLEAGFRQSQALALAGPRALFVLFVVDGKLLCNCFVSL